MKGLYKGRYLIAVYDKNDFLVEVACFPSELKCFKNKNIAKVVISQILHGVKKSNKIYLIDCLEKHDDIFAEEDKLFLDYIQETKKKTNPETAKKLGIPERTFYRKKPKNKEVTK